jgi:hypothetical protein
MREASTRKTERALYSHRANFLCVLLRCSSQKNEKKENKERNKHSLDFHDTNHHHHLQSISLIFILLNARNNNKRNYNLFILSADLELSEENDLPKSQSNYVRHPPIPQQLKAHN